MSRTNVSVKIVDSFMAQEIWTDTKPSKFQWHEVGTVLPRDAQIISGEPEKIHVIEETVDGVKTLRFFRPSKTLHINSDRVNRVA